MPVIAYTTDWCPDCLDTKRLLKQLGVKYQEIDIDAVPGAEAEMRSHNGDVRRVPTLLINDKVLVEPTESELRDALKPNAADAGP
jgi:mycoredoxin